MEIITYIKAIEDHLADWLDLSAGYKGAARNCSLFYRLILIISQNKFMFKSLIK